MIRITMIYRLIKKSNHLFPFTEYLFRFIDIILDSGLVSLQILILFRIILNNYINKK